MTSDMILPFYQALTEDVNALSAQVPALATDSLQDIRRKALERFSVLGLPTLENGSMALHDIQRYLKEFPMNCSPMPFQFPEK